MSTDNVITKSYKILIKSSGITGGETQKFPGAEGVEITIFRVPASQQPPQQQVPTSAQQITLQPQPQIPAPLPIVSQPRPEQERKVYDDILYYVDVSLGQPKNVVILNPYVIEGLRFAEPRDVFVARPYTIQGLSFANTANVTFRQEALLKEVVPTDVFTVLALSNLFNATVVLNRVFEVIRGDLDLLGLINSSIEKAVILLHDVHDNPRIGFLEEVLSRRIRELGYNVKPKIVSKITEPGSISSLIETLLSEYNLVRLDYCEAETELINFEVLVDKLREIAVINEPRFVIIRICVNKLNEQIKKLLEGIDKLRKGDLPGDLPNVPIIELDASKGGDEYRYVPGIANGVLNKDKLNEFGDRFDKVFIRSSEYKSRELKSILKDQNGLYQYLAKVSRGEPTSTVNINGVTVTFKIPQSAGESDEHYLIKVFTVYHIVHSYKNLLDIVNNRDKTLQDKLNELRQSIRIEEPLSDCRVVPDIYYNGEVYEVETLYGTGAFSVKKIQETIEKYRGCGSVRKIHIVLDNLTVMMHFGEILDLWRAFRKFDGKEVVMETLDVVNKRLIPLISPEKDSEHKEGFVEIISKLVFEKQ
jgi:diacylglycerol kinase